METYAEHAQSDAATQASVAMIATPISSAHRTRTAVRSTSAVSAMSWRDVAQSFAYDAAEMPIVSRLLAGQVVLALGYFGLRGALALRERSQARQMASPLLAGLTAGVGIACAWAGLALVSRTRAAPAVTALFTYGHALRQYFPPLRPLARAYLQAVGDRVAAQVPRELGHRVTWSVLFETEPSPAIVRLAAKGDGHSAPANVIAMSSGGRGGRILGGVTEQVLHGTRLPVLVIGHQAAQTPDYAGAGYAAAMREE